MRLAICAFMRIQLLIVSALAAAACGGGSSTATAPDAGDPTADAQTGAGPGADAGVQAADTGLSGPPVVGDLPLLTQAPPPPALTATCDPATALPAPKGHHPGPCATLGLARQADRQELFSLHFVYSGSAEASRQAEAWNSSFSSGYSDYHLTNIVNSYGSDGRRARVIERDSFFAGPGAASNYASWQDTEYAYSANHFSTRRTATERDTTSPPGPPPPPALVEGDTYVVDALGKEILTSEEWPQDGTERDVGVTFYSSGVEASETWSDWINNTDLGDTIVFDQAGNPVQDDSFRIRAGNGPQKWHVADTYGTSGLSVRRTEYGHYSDFSGEPLLDGAVTVETFLYENGWPTGIDSVETDESCKLDYDSTGTGFVSVDCMTTPGPVRHTRYGYDEQDHLAERKVTDGAGAVLEDWTAVIDGDGNLLCELQTGPGEASNPTGTQRFVRYDYGCFAPSP